MSEVRVQRNPDGAVLVIWPSTRGDVAERYRPATESDPTHTRVRIGLGIDGLWVREDAPGVTDGE